MSLSDPDCLTCERVRLAQAGASPHLITEMEHTVFVVGDHQFHRGYSLVLLKEHVREPHELPLAVQLGHFAELMHAGAALQAAFEPWKLNYSCYGNTEPHVHWHIFPRYVDDPDRTRNPWLHADQFRDHLIRPETAQELAGRVRAHMS